MSGRPEKMQVEDCEFTDFEKKIAERAEFSSCYRPRPVTTEKADGCMYFNVKKHPKEALEIMNSLRRSEKLCDVTLVAGDEKFLCHKIVLASASSYFRSMFTGGMREEEMSIIPLHGIHPCMLSVLIEFAYTAEIRVNEQNVCFLLPAATMFQMNHVVEACSVFLEQQLDASNCIGITDFACEHGCLDLEAKAREYIYKHFSEVIKCDEFLQLSACQLVNLIKHDELNIKCESEIFNAVIRWVQQDTERRLCKLEGMLSAVRCHFLSPNFLENQLTHCSVLKKMPQCQEYLSRIFQGLKLHQTCPDKPRKPCSPLVIFSAGGYLRHSLSVFECYNPQTNQWSKLPDLPTPRSGLCGCTVKGSFYTVGGRNNSPTEGNLDSNTVDMYDQYRHCWIPRCPMLVPRNRVGVCAMDNMIYAVGGSQGTVHHNSAERYDPDLDRWQSIANMHNRRIGHGVACVNRLLFAVGGFDGQQRLRNVERYDPEKDEWTNVAPMNETRSGAGITSLDGYVYAVGGYNSTSQLSSVERYCLTRDVWEFVAPMKSPRSALSVVAWGGKLYALGGYDGNEFLSMVECYDPDKDEWSEVGMMSCGRSGHGVAVGPEPLGS
ncbi:kelch-like ECH-associated protein 1B [Dreissena polymorpha]|uniref:kelch-like ECH-associated protein 1B n=1 Tax=Dreissena polymorpha TaxID=45954 RepID=UPI00226424E3|nr:kelch-like ECH-associated protein 1B [Dreissena polymorpha]XP_052278135.1 kelch-like ECH-associated protein 1B [Dreissena polymorpha]XP_052278136.1 kelch-like ECH-associated protein 1B [Dreissena polymorpha]XP_052278138.1 kelch-like ECH-associated protein 1B [Dreissena polymorpha]XP_052278139.1 kelch-like ECH-associated protein 1B [Dreissena polymorpha]XP_052278140.1 kelch-like ECH-associated protein 1B [Dreissena polymorpha]XP_052278141.1 kelch-like ECH-associated protein 1B [Dreissena po